MASTSRSRPRGEEHDPFSALEPPNKKIQSSPTAKQYDVFINHRGPDTKTTLAQPLYDSLQLAGIRAYLDVAETELGDDFPSAIKNAIKNAIVHIAILSPQYAESVWCLAELALMFQTRARIIPLFYKVKPSDFRYIKNGVSEAFSKHEGRYQSHDIRKWKECLQNVSQIKGYEFNGQNDDLGKLCNVVFAADEEKKKRKIPFQVARYEVGLDELAKDFYSYCQINGKMRDKIIGICGMGGSGKTTLAKHLFNSKQSEFIGSTILFDVRENDVKGALHSLQSKFLKDLFPRNDHSFCNIEEGIAKIKNDLEGSQESKFLIVIDDVDHQKQLDALLPIDKHALNTDSLVIITTRDERLLINARVTVRYKMKEMNPQHSRELFCWHAFHRQSCKIGFESLVDSFVQACGGLPLALKVMGGHVSGSNMGYWKSELGEVKARLNRDIKDRLKISYDALEEDQKQIFMDIACFFIGEGVSRAISIWKASGWRAEHALQTLKDKCLVEVETCYDGFVAYGLFEPKLKFKMHDHLRDLGREMADKQTRQPTDNQMSHPRRLWRPEDLIGMRKIEGFHDTLSVSEGKSFRCYCYSFLSFNIEINMTYFLGSSKTSTDLQWLELWSFGGNSFIPEWIPLQNLYTLSLHGVSPARLWQRDDQVPIKLKELSCSFQCSHVDTMSDANKLVNSLGMLKNLESLKIKWDFGVDIRWNFEWNCLLKSVRELTNLQTLSLQNPFVEGELALSNGGKTTDDQFRMRSLEAIILYEAKRTTKVSISGQVCPILKSLFLSRMEDLIEVDLTRVTTLECLTLFYCPVLRNVLGNGLPRLEIFHIKFCETMREFPNFGRLSRLKRIYISWCQILQDISAIETLEGLKRIWIAYCPELKSIKAIEQLKGLKRVWIQGCRQLEGVICLKELKELKRIFIGECPRLQSMEGVEYLRLVESIIILQCPKLKSIRGVEELKGLKEMIISDSPAINCVKRLQRLPSELTTMVGRSGMPDLDEIGDTLSMADAYREIEKASGEKVKEMIHSFHKSDPLLTAFIYCAVLDSDCEIRVESDILYGTRIVPPWLRDTYLIRRDPALSPRRDRAMSLPWSPLWDRAMSLPWSPLWDPWVYISVVPEERLSEYVSSMLPVPRWKCIEKAFIMGVKADEERKSLRIVQSLIAQLCIHNTEYDDLMERMETEKREEEAKCDFYNHGNCEYLDYDDVADYIDDDDDDDHNDNASEF